MRMRHRQGMFYRICGAVVLGTVGIGVRAVADEPLQHQLVQGDAAAEAIVENLQALDASATIEVIGKRRITDQVTGNVYTVLKVRHGRKDVTATFNEETGAFAPDSGLPDRERQAVLDALPPVYRKLGPHLAATIRQVQGGVLGAQVGLDTVLDVTIYTDSSNGLDAIQEALGDVAFQRFDGPAMYAENPPIIRMDNEGVVMPVPAAPRIWAISVKLPVNDVLRVGGGGAATRIEPTVIMTPRLDVSVPRINGDDVKDFVTVEGATADIGVVDSGIDDTHPNLTARVIAEAGFNNAATCAGGTNNGGACSTTACPGAGAACNAATNLCVGGTHNGLGCCPGAGAVCQNPEDDTGGHGTHVAGIAAADNNHAQFKGMAPFAELINAKAIPGNTAAVGMALNFSQASGADVINGSYGAASARCTAPLCPGATPLRVCQGPPGCTAPAAPAPQFGTPCFTDAQCNSPGATDGVCGTVIRPCCVAADCPGVGGVCAARPAWLGVCATNANCDYGGAGTGTCSAPTSNGQGLGSRNVDFQVFTNNITVAIAAEERPFNGRCSNNPATACSNNATCAPGTCTAFPSTPNDGFNIITVGASDLAAAPSTVATFSQVGPTSGTPGRCKPDVLAPGSVAPSGGDEIDSCAHDWEDGRCTAPAVCWAPAANVGNACNVNGDCDTAPGNGDGRCNLEYNCTVPADCDVPPGAGGGVCTAGARPDFRDMAGTSMATPHVSGLAAVLWDWGNRYGMLNDTPYLKAVIMNNCTRLAGWTRPNVPLQPLDYAQGAGEVDALATWKAYADDLRVWQQQVTGTDEEHSHWYWIDFDGAGLPSTDPNSRIVVTLVFERHEGAPTGGFTPLNDLDLKLYDPERTRKDQSISLVDSVEHIVWPAPGIAAPPNGRYCIEVDPFKLDQGNELYAVACNYRLHFMGNVCPCIHDFGDAPDPLDPPGPPLPIAGKYPTLLANNGARHLDWTKEWLGTLRPEIDGELEKGTLAVQSRVDPFPSVSGENDANDPNDQDTVINLVDRDSFDDGVGFPFGAFLPGIPAPVDITVQCTVDESGVGPTGRYDAAVATKRLYLNAWADWNNDGDWTDAGEKIIGTTSPTGQIAIDPETFGLNGQFTIGEAFTDVNGSGEWEPGEPFVDAFGKTEKTFSYLVFPPAVIKPDIFLRFRLDYGEDVGGVANVSGNLAEEKGAAQFGEVEDYRLERDYFPYSEAELDIVDVTTLAVLDTVTLTGPTTVVVNLSSLADNDNPPNNLEEVPTEIVHMELSGDSTVFGTVTVRVRPDTSAPLMRSTGEIEENFNYKEGVLDLLPFNTDDPNLSATSYFDVYFEIVVVGETLHNNDPKHMESMITEKPPGEGETYENPDVIPLYDETGNPALFMGMEIGIGPGTHTPHPTPRGCCLPDGTCIDVVLGECIDQGGSPQDATSVCTAPEACCLELTCVDVDPLCCVDMGGAPQGTETICQSQACCLGFGCADADPTCCVTQGGLPQAGNCQPTEGCCLDDKGCVQAEPRCCAVQGASPQGAGTACGTDSDGDGIDDLCDNCRGADDAVFGVFVCSDTGLLCESDDDCTAGEVCEKACIGEIPTVSGWGIAVLSLLLLVCGKIYFGRRRSLHSCS